MSEEKKKFLLYLEQCQFESFKYLARKDGICFYSKKKMYKYLKGLKSIGPKNKKKNAEIIIYIMTLKEKYRMWNDC
jgi:hypothetical protein